MNEFINYDFESMYPNVIHMSTKGKIHIREGYRGEWVINLPASKNDEILAWCREVFGDPGRSRKYNWRVSWGDQANGYSSGIGGPRIFLRSERDVTLFRLKWE